MAEAGLAGTNLDNGESSSALGLEAARLDEVVFSQPKEPIRKLDEYEIDFNNTREFCSRRWLDIVGITKERLSVSGNCALQEIENFN
jgi:hypothetical protein